MFYFIFMNDTENICAICKKKIDRRTDIVMYSNHHKLGRKDTFIKHVSEERRMFEENLPSCMVMCNI